MAPDFKSLPLASRLISIRDAARGTDRVAGLTHQFYRYPGRFSPQFAAAAIAAFSDPGDAVLDPFMGGATAVLEGWVRGRRVIGSDLNSLSLFVARSKTTILVKSESDAIIDWVQRVVPQLQYSSAFRSPYSTADDVRTRNLTLHRARPIKKILALCLESLEDLPTCNGRRFARAVLLNAGQWALNSRVKPATVAEFRDHVRRKTEVMLERLEEIVQLRRASVDAWYTPTLIKERAATLSRRVPFVEGEKAGLVVTSPPYPGIHMLYHRWQVDGRKETPAPYWITGGQDGQGEAFYNFGGRTKRGIDLYFSSALASLRGVREVMHDGAFIVQMLSFSDPASQLQRYLEVMDAAGFDEISRRDSVSRRVRIWRRVPSRAWHATMQGLLSSSKEVVLVHRAR